MSQSLRYAHLNIMIGEDGHARALYRLEPISYPLLSDTDKAGHLWRWVSWMLSARVDWSLWRVMRAYPADEYVNEAAGMVDARHADPVVWEAWLAGHQAVLEDLGQHVPETYLAVALDSEKRDGFLDTARRMLDRHRRRFERAGGVAAPLPILKSDLEQLIRAEAQTRARLAGAGIAGRPARTEEIQWLLRRAATRGVAEPALDPWWAPQAIEVTDTDTSTRIEPLGSDIVRACGALVIEHARSLEVTGDLDLPASRQAVLSVGSFPDRPEFPGRMAELMSAPIDDLDFPVDAVLHVSSISNASALRKVRKLIIDADHLYTEQMRTEHGPMSGSAPDAAIAGRELLRYLEGEGQPPLALSSLHLAVGAPDDQTLEERVAALRDSFGVLRLERPAGLQARLYEDLGLRPDGGQVRDYRQHLTLDQVGALMPRSTQVVGHEHGALIGRTTGGLGRPVRWDPTADSTDDRPPGVFLAGTPGSGKTVTAMSMACLAWARGSVVVDLDIKPDHDWDAIARHLDGAGMLEDLRIVELSGDESMRGLLDPMRVVPAETREDSTADYLMALMPQGEQQYETVIRRAVQAAIRAGARSSLAVIDNLTQMGGGESGEIARGAADALRTWADAGIGRLGFSEPTGEGEDPDTWGSRLTSFRLHHLTLPEPGMDPAHWGQGPRMGMATMRVMMQFAMRIARDPQVHGLVLADEAHKLTLSGGATGRTFISDLLRLGRSQNTTLVLASQLVGDIGDLLGNVGTLAMFGQRDDHNARQALEALGLDPEDLDLRTRLIGFRRGLCLMRDSADRRAEVQMLVTDPGLLDALSTTPKTDTTPAKAVTA